MVTLWIYDLPNVMLLITLLSLQTTENYFLCLPGIYCLWISASDSDFWLYEMERKTLSIPFLLTMHFINLFYVPLFLFLSQKICFPSLNHFGCSSFISSMVPILRWHNNACIQYSEFSHIWGSWLIPVKNRILGLHELLVWSSGALHML